MLSIGLIGLKFLVDLQFPLELVALQTIEDCISSKLSSKENDPRKFLFVTGNTECAAFIQPIDQVLILEVVKLIITFKAMSSLNLGCKLNHLNNIAVKLNERSLELLNGLQEGLDLVVIDIELL